MEYFVPDLAYLAGVVDSDGCIGVYRSRLPMEAYGRPSLKARTTYQPKVQIRQVESQAIDLAKATFGGHVYRNKAQCAGGRPLWVWSVHSAACVSVLSGLLPYLRIKTPRAENALECCALNAQTGLRKFEVPPVIDGEPMVSLSEAARRLGKTYEVVYQAVDHGTVPFVRGPRNGRHPSVFIPESYLSVWKDRGSSPRRSAFVTVELERTYQTSRKLNRVGI